MSDDFNTALALSDLFGYFKEVSRLLAEHDPKARRMSIRSENVLPFGAI